MRTWLITLLARLLRGLFRRRLGRRVFAPMINPRNILVVKPCCLGDVLLTTPLVAALRTNYPTAQITYAVRPWARPMVASSPHIDAVLTLPETWTLGALVAVVRELRRRSFDLVCVPDRSPTLTLLMWWAGIPQRVGLDSAGRGFAYTHPVAVTSIVQHEADVYNQLALAMGLPVPPHRLFFFPPPVAQQALSNMLAVPHDPDRRLVVVHPGGGQNPGMTLHRKRWLPERWAAVINALVQDAAAHVLLIGGPGDEAVVEAVAAGVLTSVGMHVMRWDWNVLGALLQQCDLFLGHDTGMMHLATAVGTPTVAVFGPSDPQIYGPYGQHAAYVWRPTPSSPCFYEGVAQPECPCAMQCMRNVQVADVLSAARALLVREQAEA